MKFIIIALSTLCFGSAFAGKDLQSIKKRGQVRCGVTTGIAGFSAPNSKGKWEGIDVEYCRALAAALFGNPSKVKYVPLSSLQRFTALQSGEVDILSRVTTHTLSRDTAQGLNFAPVTYYDGQGLMVKKSLGVKSVSELGGASICVQQGTTSELNLADYFRKEKLKYKPVVYESNNEVVQSFVKGRCDAMTTDISGLAAERSKLKNPTSYIILKEVISKEPLAPAVRHGDDQWFDIAKWTFYAMLAAEELGVNSKNVTKMKKHKDPNIQRLLGVIPGMGKNLGLGNLWAFNIIKMVGNYSEIFEKTVGINTPLKLKRGQNALWNKGGIMYAPPIR